MLTWVYVLLSHFDEIIQDENIDPTSILPGADNYSVQDLNVCGSLHLVCPSNFLLF